MNQVAKQPEKLNRTASVASIELEEALDSFANNLRRDGYRVSTEALTAATGIFLDEVARSPHDLSRLKYRLTPLFATTETSQRDIAQRIDRFVDARGGGQVEIDDALSEPTAWYSGIAPLGFFVVAIALLLWVGPRGVPSLETPQPPPNEVRLDDRTPPDQGSILEGYPEIPLQPGVRDLPTSEVVLYESKRLFRARLLTAGAVILPLLMAFVWWVLRLSRRRHFMRLARYDYEMPRYLAEKYSDADIPISNELSRTAERLNTSEVGGSGAIDLRRTIEATARSAGFLTPVEKDLATFVDYIVLVQRLGPNDHLSRVSDIILDRIQRSGVSIRRYYYERDPRQCLPSPNAKNPIPFAQLTKSFGRHRFLVIGAAEGFFHPRTGKLLPWKEAAETFTSRTLLAARRPEHWTYHEEELVRQGYFVSSASPSGMATYGAVLGSGREVTPGLQRPNLYGAEVQGSALGKGSIDHPPERTLWARLRRLRTTGSLRVAIRHAGPIFWTLPSEARRVWREILQSSESVASPAIIAGLLAALVGAAVVWGTGLSQPPPVAQVDDGSNLALLEDLKSFRECVICPEMIVLPAGQFIMGSPLDEEGRDGDEGPQRDVSIAPFAMARTEVTFDDWASCVNDGGCQSNPTPSDFGWGGGNRPVIDVSWQDAQEYISWLNGKVDGTPYRLPSEAEWEYAARAGTTTPFAFGETISTAQANYDGNFTYGPGTLGVVREQTVPVEDLQGAANDWGLRHMHGNVWEWVEDCWHDDYTGAPIDGSPWLSEQGGDCDFRGLRGGSWDNFPQSLRSANRSRFVPDDRNVTVGFRPARTLFAP